MPEQPVNPISASPVGQNNGQNAASGFFSMKPNGTGPAAPAAVAAQPPSMPSIASLLGPKPMFSAKIMEDMEQRKKRTAKTVFWVAVFIFLAVYGFFRRELDPNFTLFSGQLGPTTASLFETSNAELANVQTDLNLVRFKTARLQLDEVNSQVDDYRNAAAVAGSSLSTTLEKQKARTTLSSVEVALKQSLGIVQKLMGEPFGIDTYTLEPVTPEERDARFEQLLVEKLKRQQNAILAETKPNLDEARLVENVLRLVQNKPFQGILRTMDLQNTTDEQFRELLTGIRGQATDELSSIDKIREKRLDWRELISDIHAVVLKADEHYGKGFFESFGGFLFSSYRFDSNSGRINLTGVTKTADSRTFTAIANLVDAVEKSPEFKDIDFRSFTKSKDQKGDYSSSLNIEFSLQGGNEIDPRDDTLTNQTP